MDEETRTGVESRKIRRAGAGRAGTVLASLSAPLLIAASWPGLGLPGGAWAVAVAPDLRLPAETVSSMEITSDGISWQGKTIPLEVVPTALGVGPRPITSLRVVVGKDTRWSDVRLVLAGARSAGVGRFELVGGKKPG
ncbi:hypothetical protein L6R50_03860 [Myxococcota bacterium]|nr:hypothetical protein [Myxococcota bacterium]